MSVVDVLGALVDGDRDRALRLAKAIDGSLLADALVAHLSSAATENSVYTEPAAFEAFIRGGGNVGLYGAVSTALAHQYDQRRPASLLDVGCGDGSAIVPALQAARHRPDMVTLVEPSAALLATAVDRLGGTSLVGPQRIWSGTVQSFVNGLDAMSFDLVESTFALHAIPQQERTDVLAALRPHTGWLALAEFDVPALDPSGRLRFLAETYERGLREYDTDRALVAQGFLMPVLTGQLAPGAARATWEQPAADWRAQVERAGYTDATVTPLFDYWSSPAFLLTARGGRP